MTNKSRLGILFTCLISVSSLARTIVISDVDDTLKITRVHVSRAVVIWNALGKENYFHGMPYFYRMLKLYLKADIHYVTNLERRELNLMHIVRRGHDYFLEKSSFPDPENLYVAPTKESKGGCSSHESHKLVTMREILSDVENGSTVILIGDNTENDPCFYSKIADEFEGQFKFYQFIRIVFSDEHAKRLWKGQVGFVSPVGIALSLFEKGMLTMKMVESIARVYAKKPRRSFAPGRSSLAFPSWVGCEGFDISLWNIYSRGSGWTQDGKRSLDASLAQIEKNCRK